MKKRLFFCILLLLTLGIAVQVQADDSDHVMGSYIYGKQARALAPDNLNAKDTSLPRRDVVDVASYQYWMTQADFNQLKKQGVKAVVVKLTEATGYENPYAANQLKMAKTAGMQVAAYHFAHFSESIHSSQATVNHTANQEAQYFASVAKKLGLASDTPMVLDAEYQGQADRNGNMIYWDWTLASKQFAASLSAHGYKNTKYYTSVSWAIDHTGRMEPAILGAKNLWVAQYLYGKPSKDRLYNTQFGAWQYSSQMYFDGTSHGLPLDISIDYSNMFTKGSSSQDVAPSTPPVSNATIKDGLYYLTSGKLAIDISDSAVVDDATIQTYRLNKTAAQIWEVKRLSNGYYQIKNPQSGKYLEVGRGETANGSYLNLYAGNGSAGQQWAIQQHGSGYSLLSKSSGRAIDIPNNSQANGSRLHIWQPNKTDAQTWQFTAAQLPSPLADGVYRVKLASRQLSLDVPLASLEDRQGLQIYGNNGTAAQKWEVTKLPTGNYRLVNVNSQKSLDARGAKLDNGTVVQQFHSNSTYAQQWILVPKGNSFVIKNANSGKVLDVTLGKLVNKTPLQLYQYNGSAAQLWQFSK